MYPQYPIDPSNQANGWNLEPDSSLFLQIMLFSSEELQLFHSVAEKKVSVEDLRLASLLMWGRSAQLHPDEIHDDSLHARTLHNAGMSKTVTHLAQQLGEGPGKVMLENAVFKLESIVREVNP